MFTEKEVAFLEAALIKRRQAAQSPDEEHDMQDALAYLEARDELLRQARSRQGVSADERNVLYFHADRCVQDAQDLLQRWED